MNALDIVLLCLMVGTFLCGLPLYLFAMFAGLMSKAEQRTLDKWGYRWLMLIAAVIVLAIIRWMSK